MKQREGASRTLPRWNPGLAWPVSAAASLYVLGCVWFFWSLDTRLGFLGSLLAFLVGLVAVGAGLLCTLLVLVGRSTQPPHAVALLALNAVAAWAITRAGDSYDRGRDANFSRHLAERNQVVRMVQTGTLTRRAPLFPTPPGTARPEEPARRWLALPAGLEHLSGTSQHVTVWEAGGATHVLFVQSRTFDSFAGFVYRSDGLPPESPPGVGFLEEFTFSRPLGTNWWWAGGVH